MPQPSRFIVCSGGDLFSPSEVAVLSSTLVATEVSLHVCLEIRSPVLVCVVYGPFSPLGAFWLDITVLGCLGVGISVLACFDSGFFLLRGVDMLDISSLSSFGVVASVLAQPQLDFGMSSFFGVVGLDSLQLASFEVDAPVLVRLKYEQTS